MENQHPEFKGQYIHDDHPVWWELEQMGIYQHALKADEFKYNIGLAWDPADKEVQLIGKNYTLNGINHGSASEKYQEGEFIAAESKGEGMWISNWNLKGRDLMLVDSIRLAIVMHEKMDAVTRTKTRFANVANCRPEAAQEIVKALLQTRAITAVVYANDKVKKIFEREVEAKEKFRPVSVNYTRRNLSEDFWVENTAKDLATNERHHRGGRAILSSLIARYGSVSPQEENFITERLTKGYFLCEQLKVPKGQALSFSLSRPQQIAEAHALGMELGQKTGDLYFHKVWPNFAPNPYLEVSALARPSATQPERSQVYYSAQISSSKAVEVDHRTTLSPEHQQHLLDAERQKAVKSIFYKIKMLTRREFYAPRKEWEFFERILSDAWTKVAKQGVEPGATETVTLSEKEIRDKAAKEGIDLTVRVFDIHFHKHFNPDRSTPFIEVSRSEEVATTSTECKVNVLYQDVRQWYPKEERSVVSAYMAQPPELTAKKDNQFTR